MRQLIRFLAGTVVALTLSSPAYAQAQFDVVKARRDNYGPGPLAPAAIRQMLTEIAADLTARFPGGPYGILEKTTGTQCAGASCDIICTGNGVQQKQWDVLIDSTGDARPAWNGPHGVPDIVIRTCVFSSTTPPPPPPPPTDLELRISILEGSLKELHEHYVAISADVNAARNAVALLKAAVEQLDILVQSLRDDLGKANLEIAKLQDQLDNRCVTGRVAGLFSVRSCPEPRR